MDDEADVTFLKKLMMGLIVATLVCCAGLASSVAAHRTSDEHVQVALTVNRG